MVRHLPTVVLGTGVAERPPEGADGRCPAALKRLVPGKRGLCLPTLRALPGKRGRCPPAAVGRSPRDIWKRQRARARGWLRARRVWCAPAPFARVAADDRHRAHLLS
ncbi:hypothetical protein GCM10011341_17390 [Frigidibacter albus]|nr:hypothetical protein GCM10011341_17390 [Frigidibacter albus]